jgi:protease I
MAELDNLRVAVLATDGFEESELTEPVKALREAGATVEILAPQPGAIQAFRHFDKTTTVPVDRTLADARPESYDALLLPGGALNADTLRAVPEAQRFIQRISAAGKPIAAICHAPWELISAGVIRDRLVTSYPTLQDDVRNAGGFWVDREVAVDQDLVTSRRPSDLPAFIRQMIRVFARGVARESRPRLHQPGR